MAKKTTIEWTNYTWNFVAAFHKLTGKRGWFCTKVNKDCAHCYAEAMNKRLGNGLAYLESNIDKVRFELIEKTLIEPIGLTDPLRVFVNSMTDYFHPAIPDWMKRLGFAVMAATPQHTYQILTKQPEAMHKFFQENTFNEIWCEAMWHEDATHRAGNPFKPAARLRMMEDQGTAPKSWPLPNVQIGITAGHQKALDEFWPFLARVPAAVRFISAEPMTENLHFEKTNPDWVIFGGESGRGARKCELVHINHGVEKLTARGIKVFVKQLGSNPVLLGNPFPIKSAKGGDWNEWPEELRVRQFPTAA